MRAALHFYLRPFYIRQSNRTAWWMSVVNKTCEIPTSNSATVSIVMVAMLLKTDGSRIIVILGRSAVKYHNRINMVVIIIRYSV